MRYGILSCSAIMETCTDAQRRWQQLNDPLRNPRDPAWQLVGVTISATALIISLFSLPNSTKLTAIIVGFMGLIACIYIIFLSRRVASASHQGSNPVQPVSDLLHSQQAQVI